MLRNNKVYIKKYVIVGEDIFEVSINIKSNKYDKFKEDITVIIYMVNNKEVQYTYNTQKHFSEKEGYVEAIQEALNQFKEDDSVQELLNWDGKLKYKISL